MFHYTCGYLAVCDVIHPQTGDSRVLVQDPKLVPYGAIAHLHIGFGNNMFNGTGLLFKRETINKKYYVILTAAHNLYDIKLQCYAGEVSIRFGRDGKEDQEECISKMTNDFRVPDQFIHDQSEGSDFGIIILNSSDYEKCPLTDAFEPMMFRLEDDPIVQVKMSGYPGLPNVRQEGFPGWPQYTQWEVNVNIFNTASAVLEYRDATTPGNSGSPVFMKIPEHNKYVVLGIHVAGNEKSGSNSATRITMGTLSHVDRWIGFDDDDWAYYPWVDSPGFDVAELENDLSPKQLAEIAESFGNPAFNTGGAIKTKVLPKMEWIRRFSYDSQITDNCGLWVKWSHAKCME